MKLLKNTLLVVALFGISSINSKGLKGTSETRSLSQSTSTTMPSGAAENLVPIVRPNPALRPNTEDKTRQEEVVQNEGDVLFNELIQASIPWNTAIQKKYNDNRSKLSQQQEFILKQHYDKQVNLLNQANLNKGPTLASFQQQQVSKQVVGTVATTSPTVLERLKNWWSGKETSEALVQATPWAALAATTAGIAVAPVVVVGLGTAAAAYAVSSALEQLDFVKKTGGYYTTKSYEDRLRSDMALMLNDQGAYPYFISRIEAMGLNNEIYPVNKDEYGIAKKIMNELQQKIIESSKKITQNQQAEEDKFAQERDFLRTKYNYATANPESYMTSLKNNENLIKAQALVSEYSRARNRKIVEEKNKKQSVAELAKTGEVKATATNVQSSQPAR